MKILYVASEAAPFMSTGGLADVAGALPKVLRQRMVGCRVVIPYYEEIPQVLKDNMRFVISLSVPVAWRKQYCGVFESRYEGVTFYFIDNEYYFKRKGVYGHYDDAERFAFFSRAVLEMIPLIGFKPDIIHCNDWQSALSPVFYHLYYAGKPGYENIKTIFTIHNIQYQGKYGRELLADVLGIPETQSEVVEYDKCVNFMKGAIECANRVTTVSPTYAEEILDPWYSHGLDPILTGRSWKLQGILNGIDCDVYNPETDKNIFANFSAEAPENKALNKSGLQELLGLPVQKETPLIGIVSRLVAHKGFDLIREVFDAFLASAEVQVAVLGAGDWQYEEFFKEMQAKYPDKLVFRHGYIPELSRKIYAGADIFLMPSKSEPCGLAQMIALRYGTIPIVRETGGLKDSISDSGDGFGNGFTFKTYTAGDMLRTMERAIEGFANQEGWDILVKRALACDNSWGRSAGEYMKLYKSVLSE